MGPCVLARVHLQGAAPDAVPVPVGGGSGWPGGCFPCGCHDDPVVIGCTPRSPRLEDRNTSVISDNVRVRGQGLNEDTYVWDVGVAATASAGAGAGADVAGGGLEELAPSRSQ